MSFGSRNMLLQYHFDGRVQFLVHSVLYCSFPMRPSGWFHCCLRQCRKHSHRLISGHVHDLLSWGDQYFPKSGIVKSGGMNSFRSLIHSTELLSKKVLSIYIPTSDGGGCFHADSVNLFSIVFHLFSWLCVCGILSISFPVSSVSVLAVEEYEEMQVNLQLEKDLRKKAESFAQEVSIQRPSFKRLFLKELCRWCIKIGFEVESELNHFGF